MRKMKVHVPPKRHKKDPILSIFWLKIGQFWCTFREFAVSRKREPTARLRRWRKSARAGDKCPHA